MKLFGMTLNIFSMVGLVVGVGMLVDNAIVVFENITRLRERGRRTETAVSEGTGEVMRAVMAGSVVISVVLMLAFAGYISNFISRNPDFEILGLFVLLLIGFVLFLEGGHVAHLTVGGSEFPFIPQWIVIFILLLMFSVDLYQNWWERKVEKAPVVLHRRKK